MGVRWGGVGWGGVDGVGVGLVGARNSVHVRMRSMQHAMGSCTPTLPLSPPLYKQPLPCHPTSPWPRHPSLPTPSCLKFYETFPKRICHTSSVHGRHFPDGFANKNEMSVVPSLTNLFPHLADSHIPQGYWVLNGTGLTEIGAALLPSQSQPYILYRGLHICIWVSQSLEIQYSA